MHLSVQQSMKYVFTMSGLYNILQQTIFAAYYYNIMTY